MSNFSIFEALGVFKILNENWYINYFVVDYLEAVINTIKNNQFIVK